MFVISISANSSGQNIALYQHRVRSKLRYRISPKTYKEKYEIVIYNASDGVHMDFVKYGDKKTIMISLKEEQIRTWQFIREMVNKAVKKREHFRYDIGDDIKVTHEKYRKVFYVCLRLWYPDDAGDFQPSKYGLNIPHEVWHKYMEGETPAIVGKKLVLLNRSYGTMHILFCVKQNLLWL